MCESIQQDLCLRQLFISIKGQGSIESSVSVVQCTEFLNSNPIEKFVISHNQSRLIAIEEEFSIKQFKVKNLKRDLIFKSMHTLYSPIKQLECLKNQNYFYFCNSKFQLKFFQVNNGKIKQICSMINQRFNFLRQIFVKDDNFIFVAIPLFIQQYCIYTKKLVKQYEIDNSYGDNCFDYSIQDKLLVSQNSQTIKVWFIDQNYTITKQSLEAKNSINKHLRLNKRQIYKLQQGYQEQFFMLWIYQISQDNKEITTVNSIQIDNYFQFVCTVYSNKQIYNILQNYDLIRQECQNFSISQIDSQYKYLAIIEKQIYIRNKKSNNITNEFMSVK